MNRIMFVCHGNICRSPMAEFILKDMVKKLGVESDFIISSSATSTEEIYNGRGNPVYPAAGKELRRHGIDPCGKYAVRLKKEDYVNYDIFVVMDSENFINARRMLSGDPEGKVKKLLSYAGEDGDVADPWYTNEFESAYNDIYRGCRALLCSLGYTLDFISCM